MGAHKRHSHYTHKRACALDGGGERPVRGCEACSALHCTVELAEGGTSVDLVPSPPQKRGGGERARSSAAGEALRDRQCSRSSSSFGKASPTMAYPHLARRRDTT